MPSHIYKKIFFLDKKKKLLEQLGIKPGSGCSNVGQRYPPDKSLSNGYAIGKSIVLSTFRRTGPRCFMTFSLTLPNGWLTLWYYVLLDYVMTNIVCEHQSVGNHKYHWTLLYVRLIGFITCSHREWKLVVITGGQSNKYGKLIKR